MRPRRRPRPVPAYTRRALAEHEEIFVYRIVRVPSTEDEHLVRDFTSRRDLGLPPRGFMGEDEELAAGLSAYLTADAARGTARAARRGGRDLGGFIAELRLAGEGFEIAEHGANGHLTVWGDPLMLSSHVVDIVTIEDGD